MQKTEVVLHEGQIMAVQIMAQNGTKKNPCYEVADVQGDVFTVAGKQFVKDYYRACRLEFIVADAMKSRGARFGSVN